MQIDQNSHATTQHHSRSLNRGCALAEATEEAQYAYWGEMEWVKGRRMGMAIRASWMFRGDGDDGRTRDPLKHRNSAMRLVGPF